MIVDDSDARFFSSDYHYVSFVGTPPRDAPWMLKFGGHHLALNVTMFGPDLTFSPFLTGGQPLHIRYEGQDVYITEAKTKTAKALLDRKDVEQKIAALRSDQRARFLQGPGQFSATVAPEGLISMAMSPAQQALLLDAIS